MQPKRFFSVMCVLELIDEGQSLLWFCTVSPKAEGLCKEGTASSVSHECESVYFYFWMFYMSSFSDKNASVFCGMTFSHSIISQ